MSFAHGITRGWIWLLLGFPPRLEKDDSSEGDESKGKQLNAVNRHIPGQNGIARVLRIRRLNLVEA